MAGSLGLARLVLGGCATVGVYSVCYLFLRLFDSDQADLFWLFSQALGCSGFVWLLTLQYSPSITKTIISQASLGTSFRDAVRSTWTNISVLSTLVLAIVVQMWSLELTGDRSMAHYWFQLLVVSATAWAIVAAIAATFCLIFTDVLSDSAMKSFLSKNLRVVGYPLCFFAMSMFAMALSLIVLNYIRFGVATAIMSSLLVITAIVGIGLLIHDLYGCENKVDRVDKDKRRNGWIDWSPADVKRWLEELKNQQKWKALQESNMSAHARKFEEEYITGKLLPSLTTDEIGEIDSSMKIGARKELVLAICELCHFDDMDLTNSFAPVSNARSRASTLIQRLSGSSTSDQDN